MMVLPYCSYAVRNICSFLHPYIHKAMEKVWEEGTLALKCHSLVVTKITYTHISLARTSHMALSKYNFPMGLGRRRIRYGWTLVITITEVYHLTAGQLEWKNIDRNKYGLFKVQGNNRHKTQEAMGPDHGNQWKICREREQLWVLNARDNVKKFNLLETMRKT